MARLEERADRDRELLAAGAALPETALLVLEPVAWPAMDARGLIGDEGPALGYETALEELLSLVGRRVEVTVISVDPLGVVAEFAGELTRGDDVRHPSRTEEGEAFRFAVGAGNSFSVEARLFREAGWVRAGATTGSLRLYLGATAVEVWAEEPGELRSKLPDGEA